MEGQKAQKVWRLAKQTDDRAPVKVNAITLVPQPKPKTIEIAAMTILSDSVLVESKSARDNQLEGLSHDRVTKILNKVKALYFALWHGVGTSTTDQMAQFYEVPADAVQKVVQRHRSELESDGLRTLKGKDLKSLRTQALDKLSIPEATTILTVWTPRAALRLGMLLRDSAVAKIVRTALLDAVETLIPAQSTRIRELELELELARATDSAARSQERLMLTTQAIATMHGSGMVALVLGKPDAVVELPPTIVEKTVLVNQSGKPVATYQGLSKTKLAKRYGMKKPQDVVSWLASLGKSDLLRKGITAAPCEFVPWEFVHELDRLWSQRQGSRQRLLGE